MIYILTAVHNRLESTKKFIQCLDKQTYRDFKLVIVDDGSTDGTGDYLKSQNVFVLQGDGSLWWTGSMNLALKYAVDRLEKNDFVLFINTDVIIGDNYLENILKYGKKYDAIVGSVSNLHTGILINNKTLTMHEAKIDSEIIDVDCISTRGTLVPAEIIKKMGLFDQKNFPHYTSDYDYFYRVKKAGYRIIISPKIYLETDEHTRPKPVIQNISDEAKFILKHSVSMYNKVINICRYFGGFIKWR